MTQDNYYEERFYEAKQTLFELTAKCAELQGKLDECSEAAEVWKDKYADTEAALARALQQVDSLVTALEPFANPPVYVFDALEHWVPTVQSKEWIGGGYATTPDYTNAKAAYEVARRFLEFRKALASVPGKGEAIGKLEASEMVQKNLQKQT